MTAIEVIDVLQVLGFLGAALAAVWQWYRQRTRPAAYLAAAFAMIAGALLIVRSVPDATPAGSWEGVLAIAALAAFPWLLAAFAWSFEGPLPGWLRLAGLGVPALAAWAIVLPPTVDDVASRTPAQQAFVGIFLGLWAALAGAMATRLWRAGSRQRLVRARMHLMATGAMLMTVALLISSAASADAPPALDITTRVLSLVAVALFVAGFAPPLPLRLWWRRRSSGQFQQLQVALIGTASPQGVAQAIAPMLADLVGGGVAIVDEDGTVLARAQLDQARADELAALLVAAEELPADTSAFPVASAWLVVTSTPYTPVFGQDELELVTAFSLHLRLALERAELYRAEQEAREAGQVARRELERTLYGLSHDLKSPTLAISGFVDLLPDAVDEAERDEMLGHIKASADYLHRLVNDLLELSRIGRTQTEASLIDLEAIVREVASRVQVAHPDVTVRIDGGLPRLWLNPVRAEQLLDNLVSNAVRHGGRDDVTVTISAGCEDEAVTLTVADDGSGIPEEERERIFELFQRGSTNTTRGSGVGLSMVRRIAETFGGTIELEEADRGACFVLRLPATLLADDRPTQPA